MKIKKKLPAVEWPSILDHVMWNTWKFFCFIIVSRASSQERKTETALKSSEDELAHTESKEDALYPRLPNWVLILSKRQRGLWGKRVQRIWPVGGAAHLQLVRSARVSGRSCFNSRGCRDPALESRKLFFSEHIRVPMGNHWLRVISLLDSIYKSYKRN